VGAPLVAVHRWRVVAMDEVTGAAAEAADHRVYDTVDLADMEWVEDDDMYIYECPCGDVFEFTLANLRAGERIAKCPSCSLRIRVVVPEDRAEGKEEDKEEKAS